MGGRQPCAAAPSAPRHPSAPPLPAPQTHFTLAHRLTRRAARAGGVWVGLLTPDGSGLYRPTGTVKCAQLGHAYPKLVHVRTEWVQGSDGKRKGGWKLTTKPERILM